MTKVSTLKRRWMKHPAFRREYEALEEEFAIARELVAARTGAGLSQAQVAQRMGTTQSVVARMESGKTLPTLRTLARFAEATGTRPVVKLVGRRTRRKAVAHAGA